MFNRHGMRYATWLLVVVALMSACVSSRHLPEGKLLLVRQQFKFPKKTAIRSSYLREHLVRRSNNRFFLTPWLMPYVELYEFGLLNYDTARYKLKIKQTRLRFEEKYASLPENSRRRPHIEARELKKLNRLRRKIEEGNAWMRLGRPLAVYDSMTAEAEKLKLKQALQDIGYLKASINAEVRIKNRRARMRYTIQPGPIHRIDSVSFHIGAPAIAAALSTKQLRKHLPLYVPYNRKQLEEVQKHIHDNLLNAGFYEFNKNHIRFSIDTLHLGQTSKGIQRLWLNLEIYPPPQSKATPEPQGIDSVGVFFDAARYGKKYQQNYKGLLLNTTRFERILRRRILLEPGKKYNQKLSKRTHDHLVALDLFRYIDIVYDSSKTNSLGARVLLEPLRPYSLSSRTGLEMRYGGYPSPFLSLGLKMRNVLRFFETIDLSGQFTIEGISSLGNQRNPYQNFEIVLQTAFRFPGLLLPWPRKKVPRLTRHHTAFRLGFVLNDRQDYLRNRLSFNVAYEWRRPPKLSYSLNLINLNLITSFISERFQRQILNFYNSYSNSFQSALEQSIAFNFSLQDNYQGFAPTAGYRINVGVETGGHLNNFYDRLFNFRDQGLQGYHFSRISFEYAHRVPLHPTGNLVWRLHTGFAITHDKPDGAVAYEKYFFSGGSNSNRAWRPRRLGPGRFTPLGISSGEIEQAGQIILELNLEYRLKLSKRWYGAFFIDASNIWFPASNKSVSPETHFIFPRSLQDLAIGTGIGLRLDISFFLLRIDLGLRVQDPARPAGKRFLPPEWNFKNLFGSREHAIVNIAINYPF